MNLKDMVPEVLKGFWKDKTDRVERVMRDADYATHQKLVEERNAQGPEVAAIAAAQIAADAEIKAREADVRAKIARAAAKAASKRAKHYRKQASKSASRASAAEVDAAAKTAEAIRISQTAAVEEVEEILSENLKSP